MFQDTIFQVAKMNLQGNSMRVLMLLLGKMDMENICIIPFTEIAKVLNIRTQHISKAMKELADKNIIIKGERKVGNTPSVRINNTLVWKGKTKTYKMIPKDYPLPEPTTTKMNLIKNLDSEEAEQRFKAEKNKD